MYTNFLTRLTPAGKQVINAPAYDEPYPTVNIKDALGKVQTLQEDQALSKVSAQYDLVQAPTAPPSGALNGGIMQFTIETNNLNYCTNVCLQLEIAETGGVNPITLVPAPLIIDFIQIYSGQTLIETVYGDALWLSNAWLTQEEWTRLSSVSNASTTFGTGSAISAGSSAQYFINIPCHLSQCEIFLPAVKPDYLFKVNFRQSSAWTVAGTGVAGIGANTNLIFSCTDITPREYKRQMDKYEKNPHTFRYVQQIIQSYSSQNLAINSNYSLKLDSVIGAFSHFMGMVRSSMTGSGLLTSDANITSIDVRESSNRSMIGGQPLLTSFLRYVKSCRIFPGQMLSNIPFLYYAFAEDAERVVDIGSTEGLQTFTGNEKLYITTGPNLTPGAFDIRFYFWQYATLVLGQNGYFQQNSTGN